MKADSDRRQRVILATNVWISAALSRTGAPALLARRVLAEKLPVFSPATFAELETRLRLPKFDRYLDMDFRQRILHDLKAAALWVDVPEEIAGQTWCRDADDDKFIHAALASGAPWLVSGDGDLLDITTIEEVSILAPAEALGLAAFWG